MGIFLWQKIHYDLCEYMYASINGYKFIAYWYSIMLTWFIEHKPQSWVFPWTCLPPWLSEHFMFWLRASIQFIFLFLLRFFLANVEVVEITHVCLVSMWSCMVHWTSLWRSGVVVSLDNSDNKTTWRNREESKSTKIVTILDLWTWCCKMMANG